MTPDHVQDSDVGASRLLTENLPCLESVALGVFFNHGSRDEQPGEQGISHLVEHMLFKGTMRRTAREISGAIESLGGSLDAFTARDYSGFYARFPQEHTAAAVELLGELVSTPRFDRADLEREKKVVLEEIKTNRESPDDLVGDLVFDALYAPHPLGAPITGEETVLDRAAPDQLRGFYARHYTARRAVIVAVGAVDHAFLTDLLLTHVHLGPDGAKPLERSKPAVGPPRPRVVRRNELTQAYVVLATPAFGFRDERRYALNVLNNALAGGTSSRLFQRLREDEGLVYSVVSSTEYFEDTGFVAVYFVTDVVNLSRVTQVLREEFARLARERLTASELEIARNWTRGSLLLSAEHPSARMGRLARYYLGLGRIETIEASARKYAAVTRDDVCALIDEFFASPTFFVSAVGPVEEEALRAFTDSLTSGKEPG